MKIVQFVCLLCCSFSCLASTLYIDKSPSVMMYAEPNSQSEVRDELVRGTPVELLKTNLKNGFSFVRTGKNESGWVATGFLTEEIQSEQPGMFERLWQRAENLFATHKTENTATTLAESQEVNTIPELQQEIKALQHKQHRSAYWFAMGSISTFLGLLLGILLGRSLKPKRPKWY